MKTRWIANALLLIGVAAIDVWIWSNALTGVYQNWENWVFDRELHGQPAAVHEYVTEKAGQVMDRVKAWLGVPTGLELPEQAAHSRPTPTPQSGPLPPVMKRRIMRPNELVGRLSIPRLHLSAIVREGTGAKTLELALGHLPSSAFPGEAGNVAVAGHRDQLFRGLRHIRKKDVIVFETLQGKYAYQVESTEIVKPQDVSVLRPGRSPELTLVTCYPFYYVGSAPERFIVKARQVPEG